MVKGKTSMRSIPIRYLSLLVLFFLLGVLPSTQAEECVENFPDGKPKIKYTVKDGKKHGTYLEYFANGKEKIRASYKDDQLHGAYVEKDEAGKKVREAQYKEGKLDGTQIFYENGKPVKEEQYVDGILTHPRSVKEIKAALAAIAARAEPPKKKGGKKDPPSPTEGADQLRALSRLNGYRYLAELPADVGLDESYIELAMLGAEIMNAIKEMTHHPQNTVQWPEEKFQKAYKGTSEGNIAYDSRDKDLVQSVDAWMYDSDERNKAKLGHRRWILNPKMGKTGFGKNGDYSCMYAFDRSREEIPDWDIICFPARGYMPVEFFQYSGVKNGKPAMLTDYCWSVSINTSKYGPIPSDAKIKLYSLKKGKGIAKDKELPLELCVVETSGQESVNYPHAIIFRSNEVQVVPGNRYWVEVIGFEKPIAYLVEFISLSAAK